VSDGSLSEAHNHSLPDRLAADGTQLTLTGTERASYAARLPGGLLSRSRMNCLARSIVRVRMSKFLRRLGTNFASLTAANPNADGVIPWRSRKSSMSRSNCSRVLMVGHSLVGNSQTCKGELTNPQPTATVQYLRTTDSGRGPQHVMAGTLARAY
jgi:hypothetical protein